MRYQNICSALFVVTKHACDRQTDGQNYDSQDRASIAGSRRKKRKHSVWLLIYLQERQVYVVYSALLPELASIGMSRWVQYRRIDIGTFEALSNSLLVRLGKQVHRASICLQRGVMSKAPSLRRTSYVAIRFHRRVWYRALSLGYACIRSLDIILIP